MKQSNNKKFRDDIVEFFLVLLGFLLRFQILSVKSNCLFGILCVLTVSFSDYQVHEI